MDAATLTEQLRELAERPQPPAAEELESRLEAALAVLASEEAGLRPPDSWGRPGGIVYLDPGLPTAIVPDLHARLDFFRTLMEYRREGGASVAERLAEGRMQVVCVGDGFHAEGRAAARWRAAFEEYLGGFQQRPHMDQEMRESLGLMEMVMAAKCAFPSHFHFLKGNHENITNELGEGNYPFRKFAHEGIMVAHYMNLVYGPELVASFALLEKSFPLLAVGGAFLVSHAEPESFFERDRLVDYREDPEVVYGLTWTDNDAAEPGSVEQMLLHYLGRDEGLYFGGHRPVGGLYGLRAGGRYVQIHNPGRFGIAWVEPGRPFRPEEDMVDIGEER